MDALNVRRTPILGKTLLAEIAFKQLAGVGEVLLGIGDRRRDPCKRFIENGDNALLFGEGGETESSRPLSSCKPMKGCAAWLAAAA